MKHYIFIAALLVSCAVGAEERLNTNNVPHGRLDESFEPPYSCQEGIDFLSGDSLHYFDSNSLKSTIPCIKGDFDGDGIPDVALFRLKESFKVGETYDVEVALLKGKKIRRTVPLLVSGRSFDKERCKSRKQDGIKEVGGGDIGRVYCLDPNETGKMEGSQKEWTEETFFMD